MKVNRYMRYAVAGLFIVFVLTTFFAFNSFEINKSLHEAGEKLNIGGGLDFEAPPDAALAASWNNGKNGVWPSNRNATGEMMLNSNCNTNWYCYMSDGGSGDYKSTANVAGIDQGSSSGSRNCYHTITVPFGNELKTAVSNGEFMFRFDAEVHAGNPSYNKVSFIFEFMNGGTVVQTSSAYVWGNLDKPSRFNGQDAGSSDTYANRYYYVTVSGRTYDRIKIYIKDEKSGTLRHMDLFARNMKLTITSYVSIKADDKSATYGNAIPALTYSATSGAIVAGEKLSGDLTRDAGTNAGYYTIRQGTLKNDTRYVIKSFTTGILSIAKRNVTVTAQAVSKTYGDADPSISYTVSGLVSGDGAGISGNFARASGENVGQYAITNGSISVTNPNNYNLVTNISAKFTVNKRDITLTANAASKIYGDADSAILCSVSGRGLAFSDKVTGAFSRAAGENAGSYAITVGNISISAKDNYNITLITTALFTVNRRNTTVIPTAGQGQDYYNSWDISSKILFTSTNMAYSDTLNGLLQIDGASAPGNYPIVQGTVNNAYNPNYNVTFTAGVKYEIRAVYAKNASASWVGFGLSASNPFILNSVSHIAALAERVNAGYGYENLYFELTENITFRTDVVPIGNYASGRAFGGTFDGKGFVLENVNISANAAGLFGYNTGVIKNLTVSGGDISASGAAGAFAAYSSGEIADCKNLKTKITGAVVGGIVGINGGVIRNCSNYAEVFGGVSGGVSGENGGEIIRSHNLGSADGSEAGAVTGLQTGGGVTTDSWGLYKGKKPAQHNGIGKFIEIGDAAIAFISFEANYSGGSLSAITYSVKVAEGKYLNCLDGLTYSESGTYGIEMNFNAEYSDNISLTVSAIIFEKGNYIFSGEGQAVVYPPQSGYTASYSFKGVENSGAPYESESFPINAGSYTERVYVRKNGVVVGSGTVAFDIDRLILAVTAADKTRVYGNADYTETVPSGSGGAENKFTYTVEANGVYPADFLCGSFTSGTGLYSHVGQYAIAQGSFAADTEPSNYILIFTEGRLTVTPKTISVKSGGIYEYGDYVPHAYYEFLDTVLPNDLIKLTGSIITEARTGSGTGIYPVSHNFGFASGNDNYNFVFSEPETAFIITQRRIIVVSGSTELIYNGKARNVTAASILRPDGSDGMYGADKPSYYYTDGGGESAENCINAGDYKMYCSAGGNYIIIDNGVEKDTVVFDVNIAKKELDFVEWTGADGAAYADGKFIYDGLQKSVATGFPSGAKNAYDLKAYDADADYIVINYTGNTGINAAVYVADARLDGSFPSANYYIREDNARIELVWEISPKTVEFGWKGSKSGWNLDGNGIIYYLYDSTIKYPEAYCNNLVKGDVTEIYYNERPQSGANADGEFYTAYVTGLSNTDYKLAARDENYYESITCRWYIAKNGIQLVLGVYDNLVYNGTVRTGLTYKVSGVYGSDDVRLVFEYGGCVVSEYDFINNPIKNAVYGFGALNAGDYSVKVCSAEGADSGNYYLYGGLSGGVFTIERKAVTLNKTQFGKEFNGISFEPLDGFLSFDIINRDSGLNEHGIYSVFDGCYRFENSRFEVISADGIKDADVYYIVLDDQNMQNYRIGGALRLTYAVTKRIVSVSYSAANVKPFDALPVEGFAEIDGNGLFFSGGDAVTSVTLKDSLGQLYALPAGYSLRADYCGNGVSAGEYGITPVTRIYDAEGRGEENFDVRTEEIGYTVEKITVVLNILTAEISYTGAAIVKRLGELEYGASYNGAEVSSVLGAYILTYYSNALLSLTDADGVSARDSGDGYFWRITSGGSYQNADFVLTPESRASILPTVLYIAGGFEASVRYGTVGKADNMIYNFLDENMNAAPEYNPIKEYIILSLERIDGGAAGLYGNVGGYYIKVTNNVLGNRNFSIKNLSVSGDAQYLNRYTADGSDERLTLNIVPAEVKADITKMIAAADIYGVHSVKGLSADLKSYTVSGLNALGIFDILLLDDSANLFDGEITVTDGGGNTVYDNGGGYLNVGQYRLRLTAGGAFLGGNYGLLPIENDTLDFEIVKREISVKIEDYKDKIYDGKALKAEDIAYIFLSYGSPYCADGVFGAHKSINGGADGEAKNAGSYTAAIEPYVIDLALAENFIIDYEANVKTADFTVSQKRLELRIIFADGGELSERYYEAGVFDASSPSSYKLIADGLTDGELLYGNAVGVVNTGVLAGGGYTFGVSFSGALSVENGLESNYEYGEIGYYVKMRRIVTDITVTLLKAFSEVGYTLENFTVSGIDKTDAEEMAKAYLTDENGLVLRMIKSGADISKLSIGSYTDIYAVGVKSDNIYYATGVNSVVLIVTAFEINGISANAAIGFTERIEYTARFSEYKNGILAEAMRAVSAAIGDNALAVKTAFETIVFFADGAALTDESVLAIREYRITFDFDCENIVMFYGNETDILLKISKILIDAEFVADIGDTVYDGKEKTVSYNADIRKKVDGIDVEFSVELFEISGITEIKVSEIVNAGTYKAVLCIDAAGAEYYGLYETVMEITVLPRELTAVITVSAEYDGGVKTAVPEFRDEKGETYAVGNYEIKYYFRGAETLPADALTYVVMADVKDKNFTGETLIGTYTIKKSAESITSFFDADALTFNDGEKVYDAVEVIPEIYGLSGGHGIYYDYYTDRAEQVLNAGVYEVIFVVQSPNIDNIYALRKTYIITKAEAVLEEISAPSAVYQYTYAGNEIMAVIRAYAFEHGGDISASLRYVYKDKDGNEVSAARALGIYTLTVTLEDGNSASDKEFIYAFEIVPRVVTEEAVGYQAEYEYTSRAVGVAFCVRDGNFTAYPASIYEIKEADGGYRTISYTPVNAGEYRVRLTMTGANENYVFGREPVYEFKITKKALVISADKTVVTYSNTSKTVPYKLSGVGAGDTNRKIEVVCNYYENGVKVPSAVNPGIYTVEMYVQDINYKSETVYAVLTVEKADFSEIKIGEVVYKYNGAVREPEINMGTQPASLTASGLKITRAYTLKGSGVSAPRDAGVYEYVIIFEHFGFNSVTLRGVITIEKTELVVEYVREKTQLIVKPVESAMYRLNGGEWQYSNIFTDINVYDDYDIEIMIIGEDMARNYNYQKSHALSTPYDTQYDAPVVIENLNAYLIAAGLFLIAVLGLGIMLGKRKR